MKKKSFLKSALAVILSVTLAFGLVGCSSDEVDEDAVAATVNGVDIMESTITTYIETFRSTYGLEDDDDWAEWMITYDYTVDSVREEVVVSYIERELMLERAEEEGVEVDEDTIDEYIDYMITLFGSEDDWEDALEDAGMTEDEYREELQVQMTYYELLEVMATEDDIEEDTLLSYALMYATYYDGAKMSSYILFDSDDEETAQEVLDMINDGEIEFADAAAEYSTDEDTAEDGGDMGWDVLNSYSDEYEEALEELDEGEVSDLVESDDGIMIIMCTEVFTAPTTTEEGEDLGDVTDNGDGTVTVTDEDGESTDYTVEENDDGSQTWTVVADESEDEDEDEDDSTDESDDESTDEEESDDEESTDEEESEDESSDEDEATDEEESTDDESTDEVESSDEEESDDEEDSTDEEEADEESTDDEESADADEESDEESEDEESEDESEDADEEESTDEESEDESTEDADAEESDDEESTDEESEEEVTGIDVTIVDSDGNESGATYDDEAATLTADGDESIEITSIDQIPEEWQDEIIELCLEVTQEDAYDEWIDEAYEEADVTIYDTPEGVSYYIDLSEYEEEEEESEVDEDAVAATVNGVDIMESTITSYIETFRDAYGLEDDDDWAEWLIEYDYSAETVREETVEYYIENELLLEQAEELELDIDEDAIDEYVDYMITLYGDEESWEEALEDAGMTEDEFREEYKVELIYEEILESMATEDDIDEETLLEYAETYATYYDGAKMSSYILFDSDDEETAQEVLDMINDGEIEFADAAAEYSTDEDTAEDGGDMGWDVLNSYSDEYEEALEELDEGEVSDLVESDDGIMIIMCTEVFTAPTTTDDDGEEVVEITSIDEIPEAWQDEIIELCLEDAQEEAYDAWIEEIYNEAEIEIYDMPDGVSYYVDLSEYVDEDAESDDEESEDEESTDEDESTDDEESTDEESEDEESEDTEDESTDEESEDTEDDSTDEDSTDDEDEEEAEEEEEEAA